MRVAKKFVGVLCGDTAKEALIRCIKFIKFMAHKFLELYKVYMKGKRFMHFEQAWMEHIHSYFTCPESQSTLDSYIVWQAVVGKCECNVNDEDQRIVVSKLMYAVYDLMSDEMKDYKQHINFPETAATSSVDVPTIIFPESKVNLIRYDGFALHSLLKKYYKHTQKPCSKDILSTLRHLRVKDDELGNEPHAIQQLNEGGLDLITPRMLPFLRELVEKVRFLVNEERYQDLGQHMIEVAYEDIDDTELTWVFNQCMLDAGVDASPAVVSRLYSELLKKMFHARVNEYMIASIGIELEKWKGSKS